MGRRMTILVETMEKGGQKGKGIWVGSKHGGGGKVMWNGPFSIASPYQDMVFEKVPFYLLTCPQHYTNHVLILILES